MGNLSVSGSSTDDRNRASDRRRGALARIFGGGGCLVAAVLLFIAGDADSQTVPADEFRNSDITVSRTSFGEDAGRLDPRNTFYISRVGWSTGQTYWIFASLIDGTGPNGAVKGTDFTEFENLRPGDPEWIQNVQQGGGSTTAITFTINDDEIYEATETFTLRIRGGATQSLQQGAEDFTYDVELRIIDNDEGLKDNEPFHSDADFDVLRTKFDEGAGTPDPVNAFYMRRKGVPAGRVSTWTLTLYGGDRGFHPNPAELGVDIGNLRVGTGLSAVSGNTVRFTTTGTANTDNVTLEIIDDDVFEGGPSGTPEGFYLGVEITSTGFYSYVEVPMTIVDNDVPATGIVGDGAHEVARAEALVDNQPRLIPMLRNPGERASEFILRANDRGLDAAGGFQAETVWGATSTSRTSDGFGDHEYLMATLGAHFRMSERLHLGGMLQFDRSGSKPGDAGESGEIKGNGWMVGPYFAMLDGSQPLYFEGRLLYGRSSNKADDLVLSTNQAVNASYDSERWLVQGRVEGTHEFGNGITLIPLADFSHALDEVEAFQDANSNRGDGNRTVAITKIQLGAEFEIPVETAMGDLKLRPGLRLVVSDVSNAGVVGNARVEGGEAADYRGRIDFGLAYRLEDYLVFGFESYYLGNFRKKSDETETYGAGLNLQFEF